MALAVPVCGQSFAEDTAELVGRTARNGPMRELLLLRPVEQIEERADLRLGTRRPAPGPSAATPLEVQEISTFGVAKRRDVPGDQLRQLGVQLLDSLGQPGFLRLS